MKPRTGRRAAHHECEAWQMLESRPPTCAVQYCGACGKIRVRHERRQHNAHVGPDTDADKGRFVRRRIGVDLPGTDLAAVAAFWFAYTGTAPC
ncbi:hypothetical protein SEA_LARS_75 [Mycobacterium phage Lars]|uniref:Uncharacterized protein n=2 Tax=Rosebushvirus rosebush TaxID=2006145 RepID=A0A2L1IYV8_9CAUD|nr:hypothetical protein SEA_OPIA_75 [Mycobacterium phage Opia]QWY80997.1 hypothetical protein SEA_LARS_75 [Mycobacterium phage Lars]